MIGIKDDISLPLIYQILFTDTLVNAIRSFQNEVDCIPDNFSLSYELYKINFRLSDP